jgi:hypothetical protein
MTRLLRVLWGAGAPGEANPMRLVELGVAFLAAAVLAAGFMAPDPVTEPVIFMCRPSAVQCRALWHEAVLAEEAR